MIIEIHNPEDAEDAALEMALRTAQRHRGARTDIYVSPRNKEGWLEYGVNVLYKQGSRLFIALIQRTPDGQFETHT